MKKRKNRQNFYPIWLIVVAGMTLGNMALFIATLAMSMWVSEALTPIRADVQSMHDRVGVIEVRAGNNKARVAALEANRIADESELEEEPK